jgi:hypothetical protein
MSQKQSFQLHKYFGNGPRDGPEASSRGAYKLFSLRSALTSRGSHENNCGRTCSMTDNVHQVLIDAGEAANVKVSVPSLATKPGRGNLLLL